MKRNRNVWVLLLALAAIAAVAALAALLPARRRFADEALPAETSAVTNPIQAGASPSAEAVVTETPAADATDAPEARAYLLVTVRGVTYQPIPLYEEHDYTIRQPNCENVLHVTADSVYMKSASCDNQDCVEQGTVTLENSKERALFNMILCLPNQVYLELYSAEEIADLLARQPVPTAE